MALELTLKLTPAIDVGKLNAIIAELKASLGPLGSEIKPVNAEKLNAELKKLSVEAEASRKEIEGIDKQVQSAAKSGGIMAKAFEFNQINTAVSGLAGTLAGLTAPMVELDKQVKNIGTLGVQNFEEFTGLALDLAAKVPDSAANIANAAYNAVSAGIQGTNEEIIKFVEVASKVAVAGVSDTNSAVNGLTSVLNAYKLQASDAGTVSDTFFAAIKLGKTSFNEMNAGLANVIPAASAAKISFSEVSAVIAQMTSLGVPTAQATTQIRAAIIELQKPGAALAGVMSQVTVEVDGVKQSLTASNIGKVLEQQGLTKTLQQIEQAAGGMGKSLTQVFSSSEAASAALLTTGSNAERMNRTLRQVNDEIAGGAATGAYEVAAQGIEARTKALYNAIEGGISRAFASLGEGANVAIQATAKIAPLAGTLASLKSFLPDGAGAKIADLAKNILAKLVPSMFAQAGATGTATTAQVGLNVAMLANPAGLVIGGIVALVAAVKILSSVLNESAAEQLEEQKATTAVLEEQKKAAEGKYQVAKAAQTTAATYRDLVKAQRDAQAAAQEEGLTKEQQEARARALEIANQDLRDANVNLAGTYPGIVDGTKTAEEVMAGLDAQAQKSGSEIIKLAGEINSFDKQIAQSRAIELNLEVAVAGEEIENDITDALDKSLSDSIAGVFSADASLLERVADFGNFMTGGFATEISEGLTGTSTTRKMAEGMIKGFKDGVFNAKNADEIAKQQAQLISKLAVDGEKLGIDKKEQQKIIASVKKMGEARIAQLEEQKKAEENLSVQTAEAIAQAFSDATATGKDTASTINELGEAFGLSKEKVRGLALDAELKKAADAGGDTSKALEGIAKKFGISQEEAKALLDKQIEQTKAAQATAAAVDGIGKSFNETLKAASEEYDKAFQGSLDTILKIREARAKGDKEAVKQLNDELKRQRTAAKEADKEVDKLKAIQEAEASRYEQKKGDDKSLYDRLKERYDLEAEVLEAAKRRADIDQANQITAEERKRNTADDLVAQERVVKVLEDRRRKLQEIGLIDATGEVNVKIKGDERRDAQKLIDGLNLSLLEQESKLREVKLKAKIEELNLKKALREAELDALRADFERALIPSSALIAELTVELEKVRAAYETADAGTKLELANRERAFLKEISQIRSGEYKAAISALDKAAKDEQTKQSEITRDKVSRANASISSFVRANELEISLVKDARLKSLQGMFDDERINQQLFEAEKKTAEEKFQTDLTKLKAREAGQRLALQQKVDLAELESNKAVLEKKLKLAVDAGNDEDRLAFTEQLDKLTTDIEEKSDKVGTVLGLMKTGFDETLDGLFEGDSDKMKESMRATLATIVGFIEKLASAAVIELVLGSEPLKALAATFGFLAPVVLGGFTKLIEGGVKALVKPVLSNILSFPTGGVFRQPTMAMIGDGSRLGGSNTEYLLREDQLSFLLRQAGVHSSSAIVAAVQALGDKFDSMLGGFRIQGQDLVLATARTKSASATRARSLPAAVAAA
jgi:TP901 family phage tail tape measure protein